MVVGREQYIISHSCVVTNEKRQGTENESIERVGHIAFKTNRSKKTLDGKKKSVW